MLIYCTPRHVCGQRQQQRDLELELVIEIVIAYSSIHCRGNNLIRLGPLMFIDGAAMILVRRATR